MRIDVKKGPNSDRGVPIMPNVVRMKLNQSGLDQLQFLDLIGRYAGIQRRFWLGKRLSSFEKGLLESVNHKIKFDLAKENLSRKLGRKVLDTLTT